MLLFESTGPPKTSGSVSVVHNVLRRFSRHGTGEPPWMWGEETMGQCFMVMKQTAQ